VFTSRVVEDVDVFEEGKLYLAAGLPVAPTDEFGLQRMSDARSRLARAAKAGAIPGGSIEEGVLMIDRLTAAVSEEADAIVLNLYKHLPEIRVTDRLPEAVYEFDFTEAFTHQQTGVSYARCGHARP
jgi:hypothetical protein